MSSVLAAFANGAIVSAVLAAAVWLALRLVPRQRLNAATRYAFWWATLAATLAMPVLYVWTPRYEPAAEIRSAVSPRGADLRPAPGRLQIGPQDEILPHKDAQHARDSQVSRGVVSLNFTAVRQPQWIAIAWLSVSLFLLGRLIVSWVLLDRRRARALPVPATLCAHAEKWLAHCCPTRPGVRIASSTEIAIPIAVGPRHPSILIPARLLNTLDDDDLGQIVLHEAAHLARRDDYALLVERLIEALFAFHPVVRWITRQLDLEREVACDDFVVEATGQPRSYASCLTRMVELCGGVRASLAGATAANDRSHLAKRVDRLLDKTRHTGTRLLKARLAAMVALLFAAGWTVGRTPGLVAFAMPQAAATIAAPAQPPKPPVAAAPQPAILNAATEPTPPVPALAESPEPPSPPSPQGPPIQIPVEVTDPMNRFVSGLTRDSFKLLEDGVEQQISQLSSEDVPLSVGIVVDVSGSMALNMGAKIRAAREAVSAFLKTARPDDEFFLIEFNDEPLLTVPFTYDPQAILTKMSYVQARGGTSLRDAVYLAIDKMKQARNHRRAILIVSDGTDNTSTHSASEMAATVRETDLQFYTIDLSDRPERRAFAGLLEAVNQPGGQDAATDNLTAAPARAARIAVGLRNLYVLTYTSSNPVRDGKYRRVQVQVVQPLGLPPLRVTYRAGYYAPQ